MKPGIMSGYVRAPERLPDGRRRFVERPAARAARNRRRQDVSDVQPRTGRLRQPSCGLERGVRGLIDVDRDKNRSQIE